MHYKNEIIVIIKQVKDVFKKYTAIFVISTEGVIGWELCGKRGIDSVRLYKFIETNITNKYKNKLIILDNASSHRLVNNDNNLLYSCP